MSRSRALGVLIHFQAYVCDASGNIVEKIIAGARSRFDYDLANQLKVSPIGSETTRYRYDPPSCCEEATDERVPVAGHAIAKPLNGIGRNDYSNSEIKGLGRRSLGEGGWVWEDAFGAGGAPQGAKALLAKGGESYSNEPHISGGVPIAGTDRVSEDEKFFVSDYLGNTMMELPRRKSTEFGKGRRDTAGFNFLTTAMGANVEVELAKSRRQGNERSEVGRSVSGDAPAMNRFTGKPYDEDLQAYVFPFRNYSAKLARWTSADPAGFPDGPNRHFYAPVPTMGLDPMGLEWIELSVPKASAPRTTSFSLAGYTGQWNGPENIPHRLKVETRMKGVDYIEGVASAQSGEGAPLDKQVGFSVTQETTFSIGTQSFTLGVSAASGTSYSEKLKWDAIEGMSIYGEVWVGVIMVQKRETTQRFVNGAWEDVNVGPIVDVQGGASAAHTALAYWEI